MLNPKGNRILFFGASDTGKTFECLMFAKYFRERENAPKRTIIFDHTDNNESYGNVKVIPMSSLDFALPERCEVRIKVDLNESPELLYEFILKCSRMMNTVIIFDDATALFRAGLPKYVLTFLGLRKNQRLEIMFQLHSIRETSPSLLEQSDVWVIKQTGDSLPLKSNCPNRKEIEKLIKECKAENEANNYEKLWATRLYIKEKNTVIRKDLSAKSWELSYTKTVNLLTT